MYICLTFFQNPTLQSINSQSSTTHFGDYTIFKINGKISLHYFAIGLVLSTQSTICYKTSFHQSLIYSNENYQTDHYKQYHLIAMWLYNNYIPYIISTFQYMIKFTFIFEAHLYIHSHFQCSFFFGSILLLVVILLLTFPLTCLQLS